MLLISASRDLQQNIAGNNPFSIAAHHSLFSSEPVLDEMLENNYALWNDIANKKMHLVLDTPTFKYKDEEAYRKELVVFITDKFKSTTNNLYTRFFEAFNTFLILNLIKKYSNDNIPSDVIWHITSFLMPAKENADKFKIISRQVIDANHSELRKQMNLFISVYSIMRDSRHYVLFSDMFKTHTFLQDYQNLTPVSFFNEVKNKSEGTLTNTTNKMLEDYFKNPSDNNRKLLIDKLVQDRVDNLGVQKVFIDDDKRKQIRKDIEKEIEASARAFKPKV